jgi:hypothetical protein
MNNHQIKLNDKFLFFKNTPGDINEHFETLKSYASKSESIVEMGVGRIISTWALLSGMPVKLISYDINHPEIHGSDINEVYDICKNLNIRYEFFKADTSKIEIDPTDLLFIDTWHVYSHLKIELEKHSLKCKKYIILHDTETFGLRGESPGHEGLLKAVDEFLISDKNWVIKEIYKNNNGLMILERIN